MATTKQLNRAKSAWTDFGVRLYVGGKWGRVLTDGVVVGASYDPTVDTNLNGVLVPTDTTVTVDSTTGFTTKIIVVAPEDGDYGAGDYEVIRWETKDATHFYGCTRGYLGRPGQTAPGHHADNALVTEWVDVTEYFYGDLEVTLEEREGVVSWEAGLSGVGFDSTIFDRDNSVLCMWNLSPDSDTPPSGGQPTTSTGWVVAFLGYIQSVDLDDDYQDLGRFELTVAGFSQYLEVTEVDAHHFGRVTLSESKTVNCSPPLTDPWLEAGTGEYTGAPDLGGDKAVDGDLMTLYISKDPPTKSDVTGAQNHLTINEVCLSNDVDYSDLTWVELYWKGHTGDVNNLKYYALVAKCTTWRDAYSRRFLDDNYVRFTEELEFQGDTEKFVVLTNNRQRYLERFGGGAEVVDWSNLTKGTFTVDKAGDFLCLVSLESEPESTVWFGSIVPYDFEGWSRGSRWSGATITVPPVGHTFRRLTPGQCTFPDTAASWKEDEKVVSPGYGYTEASSKYLSVDLEELAVTLTAGMGLSDDHAHVSSTYGFRATGYAKVENEVFYYERDDENEQLVNLLRGQKGTSAEEHDIGDAVKPYEQWAGTWQVANGQLIASVGFRRREVYPSQSSAVIVPKEFDVYYSIFDSPIYPDDADWDDYWDEDWVRHASVTGHATSNWQVSFDAVRARHVMIVVKQMSDDGRLKLNEFYVYGLTMEETFNQVPLDATWSGDLVEWLLVNELGYDEDKVVIQDRGSQFFELTNSKGSALSLLQELCRRTGTVLVFGLDGTVTYRYNPLYPLNRLPDSVTTWDRDNARSVSVTMAQLHTVSQVVLTVERAETSERFTVSYPDQPLSLGTVLKEDDLVLGSVEDCRLMAQFRFFQENAPLEVIVEPVGIAEWVNVPERHVVDWSLDASGSLLNKRNFVTRGVTWSIGLGDEPGEKSWSTSVRMVELIF